MPQYKAPTKPAPPTILPSVTGTRLWIIPDIVTGEASKLAGTLPVCVMSQANGRKYMLATLCSKPAAIKAETGNKRARILSVTDRPAYASQTAKQTSKLHRIPLKKSVTTR
jgi:hypothetical protein